MSAEKKRLCTNKKISAWDYLWYALYAFAALGTEFLLLGFVEPWLFGDIKSSAYTPAQDIIHWLLTMVCWGVVFILLVRSAKRHLRFSFTTTTKHMGKGIAIAVLLVLTCIVINIVNCGALKIVSEFQKNGLLLFEFQHLYYFFEVLLVFLIVVFGQEFAEGLLRRKNMVPWGGILLCCTWGAVHFLSKGSISTGAVVMAFSLIYGIIYLVLGRNAKHAYLAMAIAFIV